MNIMETLKKIGIAIVTLDFLALTGWAIVEGSTGELLLAHFSNPWSIQITVDLCIAAAFGMAWVWQDAKKRGLNPLPWVLAVIPTGSIALLAYLVRRELAGAPAPTERLATA